MSFYADYYIGNSKAKATVKPLISRKNGAVNWQMPVNVEIRVRGAADASKPCWRYQERCSTSIRERNPLHNHSHRLGLVADRLTAITIRATTLGQSRLTWCCHTRITVQPSLRNLRKFTMSRRRLRAILICQNGVRLSRHSGNRHPCQKSPSMKTTTRCRGKTTSGLPATPATCFLNRNPRRCSSPRTNLSRDVSRPLIRDMQ